MMIKQERERERERVTEASLRSRPTRGAVTVNQKSSQKRPLLRSVANGRRVRAKDVLNDTRMTVLPRLVSRQDGERERERERERKRRRFDTSYTNKQ
jgi:hypothetical protein